MKISFIAFCLIVLIGFEYSMSQTIVSTTPENRDAVLEEFTGRNCGFCPDGHVIAEGLKTQYGDDFWIINIHAGQFSPSTYPNLNSAHSQLINSYFSVSGYPAGTVNRHDWGQGVVHGRGTWGAATASATSAPAYCNVGVNARIDLVTRELTAEVEVYYTDNSPVASNYLSVAVLGNGVIGYQSGGDDNYEHNHFLIEMINNNGPWGDEITTTSNGDLHTVTYTWTLPETLPVTNGPDLDAETLEIVAFVTEADHDDVINADGGDVVPIMLYQNDAVLGEINVSDAYCDSTIFPSVIIINGGNNDLTTLDLEYYINNGEHQTFTWNGNLSTLQQEEVFLPEIGFGMEDTNTITVLLDYPLDQNISNNIDSASFNEAPLSSQTVYMHLEEGYSIAQISWELVNSAGDVLYSGGSYGIMTGEVNETFELEGDECYTFNIYDSYGDGFSDEGFVTLTDIYGSEIGNISGNYGTEATIKFKTEPSIYYNHTFYVEDNNGVVEGADIYINGDHYLTNSLGMAEVSLPNGNYNYNVSKSGYLTVSGNIAVIGGSVTENIFLESMYVVAFYVSDSITPLENALILIDDVELYTDEDGIAQTDLVPGNYEYTVTKDGYQNLTGSIEVVNNDIDIDVILDIDMQLVTFEVLEGDMPVVHAIIAINDSTLSTDSLGGAFVSLPNGEYPYIVYKPGYTTESGTVAVNGNPINEIINLNPDGIETRELGYLKIYPNPTNSDFYISSNSFQSSFVKVEVINITGEVKLSAVFCSNEIKGNEIRINRDNLANGIYIIKVYSKNGLLTSKINIVE